MILVINDLKKLLDKNAVLMSLMALICSFMALFFADGGSGEINKVIDIVKIDGILILFVMFGVELAKNTLVSDKISKKLEFLLANGLSIKKILIKYLFSIYLGALIIVLPSLILNLLKFEISLIIILNLLVSSFLYTLIIVLIILDTRNMNKVNSLQIRLIVLSLLVMIASILVYNFTNSYAFYLITKFFILGSVIIILGINTNKERIVVSYYWDMYKKLEKIVISHLMIILFWGLLFKNNLLAKEGPILNAVSLILFFTLYGLTYTEISNRKIPQRFSVLVIFTSLLSLSLILINDLPYKLAFLLISLISTSLFIKRYLILENIKYISILPISGKATQIFTIGLVFFVFVVIYLFDIDTVIINIFIQIIFLITEFFFILFLKEKELSYDKTFKLYYLSDYMASERDEFARIIHDDIIQDIFASKNFLSSKNPDIEYTKNILRELEGKVRNIMKFYQSSLFEKANLETSLLAIFDNVGSLYPDKNIEITKYIDSDLTEDKRLIRLISIISKELINNVYKHSDATYLNYKLYRKESLIVIEMDSDGASLSDYEKIKESKRGVLLLNLLIDSNSGNISYGLNNGILTTKVSLEVGKYENYFAWWS